MSRSVARFVKPAAVWLSSLAMAVGGMIVAPAVAHAATGDLSCDVDKATIYPGESVTITAKIEATDQELATVEILDGSNALAVQGIDPNRRGRAEVTYTDTPTSTTTYACAGGVIASGGNVTPTPLAVTVTVQPTPTITCDVSTSQPGFFVGDGFIQVLAKAKDVDGSYVTEIERAGSVVATGSSDYATYAFAVASPGPLDFTCRARSAGKPEATSTASITVEPQPSPPTGDYTLGDVQNSSGVPSQVVSWTVAGAPNGWDVRWLDSYNGYVTPPTTIPCDKDVTLQPRLTRINNFTNSTSTVISGAAVTAKPDCKLPAPNVQSTSYGNDHVTLNYNISPGVPAGTQIEAEYRLTDGRSGTQAVGTTGAPRQIAGSGTQTDGSVTLPPTIRPPVTGSVKIRLKLGSVISPWSSETSFSTGAPPLSYSSITGQEGKAISGVSPQTNAAEVKAVGGTYTAKGLPKGLSIDGKTGEISGTPLTSFTGSVPVTLTWPQATGPRADVTTQVSIDIKPPPPPAGSFTYPSVVTLYTGSAASVTATRTGLPTPRFFYAPDLCSQFPGLDIDPKSGKISGTPIQPGSGKVTVTVTSTPPPGSSGCTAITGRKTADTTVSIKVKLGLTLSYSPAKVTAPVGQPIASLAPLSPAGTSLAGTTFAVSAGVLPAGLSLNSATGVISGAPTQDGPGHVSITATNGVQTATADVDFSIFAVSGPTAPHYPDTSSAIGTSATLTPANASGWGPPFSLAPGAPAGMTIDPTTGTITWTASAPVGARSITVRATSPAGPDTALSPFTWAVTPAPASSRPGAPAGPSGTAGASTGGAGGSSAGEKFTPCLAPAGQVFTDIHGSVGATLTVAANLAAVPADSTFAVVGGSLPPGTFLDGNAGVLSGTPERVGTWPVQIAAEAPDGRRSVSDIAISVDDPHHAANYPNRVRGSRDAAITITPFEVNPHGKTTYELVCGTLPAGTMLNAETGVISGTPTVSDLTPVPLRVRMTDDYGSVDSSFIFTVEPGQIPWLRYPEFSEIGSGLRATIVPTVSGMPSVAEYSIDGDLPPGLAFDPRTGVISGIAKVRDGEVYEPTITALDAQGQPLNSAWASMTVIKPAVPMHVKARAAKKKVTSGSTTVVVRVRHPKYSSLSAEVLCKGCKWTFNKKSGKLVVRKPEKKTWVTVYITASPKGTKARTKYAGHEWHRSWRVK